MGNIFAASEIVEIGVQIEKNGRDFYNSLTAQSNNPKAKEIFKFLGSEEEKHIAVFQKILASTEQYEVPSMYRDEYYAYMNVLASEYVFTKENKGTEIAKKIGSDKEAVNVGIGFEKDSIVFYEGIKKVVPEYDRKIIDELILQEQSHLVKLSELKAEL